MDIDTPQPAQPLPDPQPQPVAPNPYAYGPTARVIPQEPVNPQNHGSKKPSVWVSILAAVVFLLLAGGAGFFLGQKTTPKVVSPVVTPTPIVISPTQTQEQASVSGGLYESSFIKFSTPSDWKVTPIDLAWGEVNEKVNLGIPLLSGDQTLGFSTQTAPVKPTYVLIESDMMIGGVEGYKWVGRGDTFISYDYVTKVPTKNGLFMLHVTTDKEDAVLEKQLDTLVESIVFKPE